MVTLRRQCIEQNIAEYKFLKVKFCVGTATLLVDEVGTNRG